MMLLRLEPKLVGFIIHQPDCHTNYLLLEDLTICNNDRWATYYTDWWWHHNKVGGSRKIEVDEVEIDGSEIEVNKDEINGTKFKSYNFY